MSLPETFEIGPADEASRLWNGASAAYVHSGEHLVSLCEALDLGLRAVEILALLRLQPVRSRFPATVGMLLESPDPEVSPRRDAIAPPPSLDFVQVLDMLSADDLDCVARKMHRGWEDRRRACGRARALARETLGVTLDAAARDKLLLLAAYRNRLFRVPPPVVVEAGKIRGAFPELEKLYGALAGDYHPPTP